MTQAYQLQQEILNLFQGKEEAKLSLDEINTLNVYKSLVIDGADTLLSKIFPEINKFLKARWKEVCKDYLEQHPSNSPLYYKICENFPDFVNSEFFKEKYASNNYFYELIAYKWLEIEIYNSPEKKPLENGFIQNFSIQKTQFNLPLIVKFLNSEETIDKDDDMEEEDSILFIYRTENRSKTLVINDMCLEFIEKLADGQNLIFIKEFFTNKYSDQVENIDEQINNLINYLINMKILLI